MAGPEIGFGVSTSPAPPIPSQKGEGSFLRHPSIGEISAHEMSATNKQIEDFRSGGGGSPPWKTVRKCW